MRRLGLLLLPLASAIAALAFFVATAAPAGAATAGGAYAPGPTAGAIPDAPVSPSGCFQRADNPHLSKHSHDILGKVWTKCPLGPVPSIHQTVQLWEMRWWGWDRVGTKAQHYDYSVEYAAAFAHASCRQSLIRSTGSGTVVDVDGHTYYAATESKHIDNPCGL